MAPFNLMTGASGPVRMLMLLLVCRVTSRPSACRTATMSARVSTSPATASSLIQSVMLWRTSSRPACSEWDGTWTSLARSGSSGLAQPCSAFHASRSGSKSRCQPGGAGLYASPLLSSVRAISTCTCTPSGLPASPCCTAVQHAPSSGRPANATRSKSSNTALICSGVGWSSGAHAITPLE